MNYYYLILIIGILAPQLITQATPSETTPTTTENNATTNNSTTTNTTTNNSTTTNTTTNNSTNTTTNSTTNNSTTDEAFKYICSNEQSNITIGQNVTVCIHFYPSPYRMAFQITVDEYSVLSIGGAYNYVAQSPITSQSFIFQMASNITLYPSLYYNKIDKFIVPVFNVVIKVDNGKLQDVVWDNDCWSCGISDNCYTNDHAHYLNDTNIKVTEKNCKQEQCVVKKESVFQCDPKFYITWFGTDAKGKQLKSSNMAMSRFRQYSVGSLYNSAKDAFNNTLTTLQNTWEDVKKATDNIIKGIS